MNEIAGDKSKKSGVMSQGRGSCRQQSDGRAKAREAGCARLVNLASVDWSQSRGHGYDC